MPARVHCENIICRQEERAVSGGNGAAPDAAAILNGA